MYITDLLNEPFPVNSWRWYKWRGTGFGLFVFLFLFLFKPFRLDLYPFSRLFYTAAMYGFVTGAVILAGGSFFVKVIAPYIKEEKWTLGKQILLNMVLMISITIFNVLVTQLVHQITLPLWWHLNMLKWVLMLGALPVAIAELISYNYYLRQHVKSAEGVSKDSSFTCKKAVSQPGLITNIPFGKDITTPAAEKEIKAVYKKKPPLLTLTGENQSDRLEIPYKRLLAVQALDNYVNIFWEQDNKLQTTLLRNTLTNISEQLSGTSCMYRCHRGWMVNTQRVVQVEGNAQGLRLSVDFLPQPVPVSRANIAGYRKAAEQHLAMQD